jgi:hypothetical protein
MNLCLSRSTIVNGYVTLAHCESTPYILLDRDENFYVMRIESLYLDIDDVSRLIVIPCRMTVWTDSGSTILKRVHQNN